MIKIITSNDPSSSKFLIFKTPSSFSPSKISNFRLYPGFIFLFIKTTFALNIHSTSPLNSYNPFEIIENYQKNSTIYVFKNNFKSSKFIFFSSHVPELFHAEYPYLYSSYMTSIFFGLISTEIPLKKLSSFFTQ